MNPLSKLDKDQLRKIFKKSSDRILNQIADKLYDLDVDGDNLVNMTKEDYFELGFTFGQRKKLMRVISAPLKFVNIDLCDEQKDNSSTILQFKPDVLQTKIAEPPLSPAPQLKPPPPGPPILPRDVRKTWKGDGTEVRTIPLHSSQFENSSLMEKVDRPSPIVTKPSSPQGMVTGLLDKSSSLTKVDRAPQSPKISYSSCQRDREVKMEEKRETPKKRARESTREDELETFTKSRLQFSKILSAESSDLVETSTKLKENFSGFCTFEDNKVPDSKPPTGSRPCSPNLTLSSPVQTSTESSPEKTSLTTESEDTKPTQEVPSGDKQGFLATSIVKSTVQEPSPINPAQYGLTESFLWDPKHRHFFEASTARVYKPEHPQIGNFWDVENKIYLKVHPQQYKLITAHYAVDSDIKQQLPDSQSVQAAYYQGYAYPQSGYAYGNVYPYSAYGYTDSVSSSMYGEAISQFYDQANVVFKSHSSQATTIAYQDNSVQTTAQDYFQQKSIVEQQAAEYRKLLAKQRQAAYEKELEKQKKTQPRVTQPLVAKPAVSAPTEPPRPKRRRTSRFSAGPAKVHGLGKFEVISHGKQ